MDLIVVEIQVDHGGMVPVNVFYNIAERSTGRSHYRNGDPLVQVAATQCPESIPAQLVGLTVTEQVRRASKDGGAGDDPQRHHPPFHRQLGVGDVISIGDAFYATGHVGFEKLHERPSNITYFTVLPY